MRERKRVKESKKENEKSEDEWMDGWIYCEDEDGGGTAPSSAKTAKFT